MWEWIDESYERQRNIELVPTISGSQNSYFSKSESTDLSAPFETLIIIICLLIVLVVSVILLSVFLLAVSVSLLDSMMVRTSVAHADICWALMIVLSNYSKGSCDDIGQLFKVMFPDSNVAESISWAKTKSRFIITYGIKRNPNILSLMVLLHIPFNVFKMN